MSLNIQPPASGGLSTARSAPAIKLPYPTPSADVVISTETHVALAALLRPSTSSRVTDQNFASGDFGNVSQSKGSDLHAGVAGKSDTSVPAAAIDHFACSTLNGMLELIKFQGKLLIAQSNDPKIQKNTIQLQKLDDKISRFLQSTKTSLRQLVKSLIEDQPVDRPSSELENKMRIASEICLKIGADKKTVAPPLFNSDAAIHSSELGSLHQQSAAEKLVSILSIL